MPVFFDNSCIFIHIPKTAGTTINHMFNVKKYKKTDALYENDGNIEWDHATAHMVKLKNEKRYELFYKFAIVRNPYDRLVSEYFFKKESNDIRIVDCSQLKFDEYIDFLYKNFDKIMGEKHSIKSHFIPQSNFILSNVNIFKFENIKDCFDMIEEKFNIKNTNEFKNKSTHDFYEAYYDRKLKQKVADIYYLDFKLLGYDLKL